MKHSSTLMPPAQRAQLAATKSNYTSFRRANAELAIPHRCLISVILASVFLLSCAATLHADEKCMPAVTLEATLIDWYGESPIGEGPRDLVVWSSANGETWTLVAYHPDGTACTLNHGQNWTGAASLAQLASDRD